MAIAVPDEREIFDLQQFIAAFDLGRVSIGGPVFDLDRLMHLNGVWLLAVETVDIADELPVS